ncbi:MAG: serine/threonine protein kinase [Myxococcales bacterium]|nr:serine/threonine protein kinase [Myxococcales bacterium]
MGTAPKTPKAPDPPPLSIKIGEVVLDRYRVVEQIASGGHSVVFRGLDERLSRPVCIKVFSGLGGKSGVGRTSYEHFVQEAFALSRLTHPNTLRIYDFGHLGSKDVEGMPLQVCEYMNGGTLSQIVREQGVQSISDTAVVVSAMCAALSEAHGLGIVHRDIKPQNILFGTVAGKKLPKLADFGIAKWSVDADKEDSGQRAEDTAIVAGQKLAMYSPSWAAPEQLAGQPVSPATDIYSLAVVAVYMLSGKAIFADEDVYAGYKKRRHADELVRDALKPHGISAPVIALLNKALAFDPKKRILKVDELSAELMKLVDGETEEFQKVPGLDALTEPGALPLPLTPTSPTHAITPPAGSQVVRPTVRGQGIQPERGPDRPPERAPERPIERAPEPPIDRAQPEVQPAYPIARSITPTSIPAGTPASWHQPPPVARPPWMQTSTVPGGPSRTLALSEHPQGAGERNVHFLQIGASGQVDLSGTQNSRVRITMIHSPSGLVIHLKGLTCFVAHLGGRPSPAVQIDHPSDIAIVTPRAQEIGHIRVATGIAEPGQNIFALGNERIAIRTDDCTDPILFDFGPGSDAYFVYTRGRPVPRLTRRG